MLLYLIEERRERSRLLGDVAAKDEDKSAIDQVEGVENTFVGRVGGADIDKGKLVQHRLF